MKKSITLALPSLAALGLLLAVGGAQHAAADAATAKAPATAPARPGTVTTPAPPPGAGTLVQQGAYLARAADCIACHTTVGGKPFAGGLKMDTPIGAIYSSNITPDKQSGIGNYTYADFEKAVRHGITPGGSTLYPAMPYPSYARVSDGDMKALYAYFMQGVAPVAQPNKPVDIVWPLSMRWPLAAWRMAFAPDVKAPALSPSSDQQLLRGAYLAESLGHCGACHTPRSVTMQEKALTDANPLFLSGGGTIDGWIATNLRGDHRDGLGSWSTEDIKAFLLHGRNNHAAAFGGMSEVVTNSTQYMSDADLSALAYYLKSLAPNQAGAKPVAYDDKVTRALRAGDISQPGAQAYLNRCAACHRSDGAGYTRVFPALAGNPAVQGDDASAIMHIVLSGSTLPATRKSPSSFTMPGFARQMNDQDVADVVNFVRSSWGNHAPAVSASDVAKERKQPHNRAQPVVSEVRP
jgi:mono/diheme cytochrome c family protein